jgi:lysophospholipase L1-like esterase
MRLLAVVLVIAVAVAVLVLVATNDDESRAARTGAVFMVGDSLNVGLEPYLERELRGWDVSTDDVVGRGTDDGIAALEAQGAGLAPVVVVSLGTNDSQDDVDGFRADVRRVRRIAGQRRCVIWATIWRHGANTGFNEVLADEADGRPLRVVLWDEMVAAHPEWLTDGVHATPDGYEARARAIADAVRDCVPESA